ncbi:DUF664 domain-containing protein [Nesterenkonia sp. F]|uniref:mycothiol transferase n=1 Tax=Nesterenkonia sp. F TaxID=795955 RepID=UPI000255C838|nr:DUF664 domain-containing protein [Nesterenkonia sp. F]
MPATDGVPHDDEVLVAFILTKFDELVELVASGDDATANAVPAAGRPETMNSPIQLLVHVCGMMRRWSCSVNRGLPVPRDRDAEFTARMPVADALALASHTRADFLDDVAATDLDAAPAAVPAGRDHPWTASCRGVLLHVFEEVCQHLGHAEITRDVVDGPGR